MPLVLFQGGPIATPEDASYILRHCKGVAGFLLDLTMDDFEGSADFLGEIRRFRRLSF
jgi:predicted TIM-barrel enzyme